MPKSNYENTALTQAFAEQLSGKDLQDVSYYTREIGFLYPVYLTQAVHDDLVEWDAYDVRTQCQDNDYRRLGRIINELVFAINTCGKRDVWSDFRVNTVKRDGSSKVRAWVDLRVVNYVVGGKPRLVVCYRNEVLTGKEKANVA